MFPWTKLSLRSLGCELEEIWRISSQKHLTPQPGSWHLLHAPLLPPHSSRSWWACSVSWAAQMLSPGSGHEMEKAKCLGGGCLETLIHPDWHSCGTSAGGLCHLQTGDGTAGAVSKLHCTKIALMPALPSAGRVLAGTPMSVLHQHIWTTPVPLPTGPACSEQQLQAPDAAAERIWSSILQSIQQIIPWESVPSPQGFCCSRERNGY